MREVIVKITISDTILILKNIAVIKGINGGR
jgi:hypothetical protein